jgi:hypothetical protein
MGNLFSWTTWPLRTTWNLKTESIDRVDADHSKTRRLVGTDNEVGREGEGEGKGSTRERDDGTRGYSLTENPTDE